MSPRRVRWGWLASAVAAGTALRFWNIGRESLWHDEAWTGCLMRLSLPDVFDVLVRHDAHPPLYDVLLRGWAAVWGSSEAALRSFSALAGVAAIPLLARLAQRVGASGSIAAWLLALAPFHIHFSREARSYALLFLLATASLNLLSDLRELKGRDRRWRWISLALLSAAIVYTHYLGALFVLSEAAMVLIWRVELKKFAVCALGAFALFAPWLPIFLRHAGSDNVTWLPAPTAELVGTSLAEFTFVGATWIPNESQALFARAVGWPELLTAIGVAGLGWLAMIVRGARGNLAWLAALIVPPVAELAISLAGRPMYYPRTMICVLAPLFVLVAAGATRLGPLVRPGAVALLVLAVLPGIVWTVAVEKKEDWRGAVNWVRSALREGEEVRARPYFLSAGPHYYGLIDAGFDDWKMRNFQSAGGAEWLFTRPWDAGAGNREGDAPKLRLESRGVIVEFRTR